jgi:hypothetical protein
MSVHPTRYAGRSDRVPPPHHVGFNRALEEAVAQAAAEDPDWRAGETRSFSVNLSVEIVKTNPGWVGSYVIGLSSGD